MSITIRHYRQEPGYTEDFYKVCDFLARINSPKVITPHYLWARWVWQFGPYMSKEYLWKSGIAEDEGVMVGLVTYENDPGEAYFSIHEGYTHIMAPMMDYAIEHLSHKGSLALTLPDGEIHSQRLAVQKGFLPTTHKTAVAMIDIGSHPYALPQGYRIMSFDDPAFDAGRYYDAIWRGFDNQRQRNKAEIESMGKREGIDGPYVNPNLRILVVSPKGDYAAHCGMWHRPGTSYAYVEPVFTLPEYRKMGLGKGAVYEGLNRCGKLGAKVAYVGSAQQFYYSIGFYPVQNETWWKYQGALK